MKFQELLVLLPCHSLEDFPLHETTESAESLLAAWSALWHPALVAAAGQMPHWQRADGPPDDVGQRLVVIPRSSEPLLPSGWLDRAEKQDACLLRGLTDRSEIVQAALERLDGGAAGVDPELAAEFLALGFGYLQVELLTRHMRYMSGIDETVLGQAVVAAARAALAGDQAETDKQLGRSFDVLTEARERFYPVDAYLIDLTLVAETTLGPALRASLADQLPFNLLLPAAALEAMAAREPASLAALRQALEAKHVSLAGAERRQRELPLLAPEAVLREFRRGAEIYQTHLGQSPTFFGRRRFGLSPILPQLLTRLGYTGALHMALDEGHFPIADQSRTRWEGLDHSAVETLARLPLDAQRAESFLRLPQQMGDAMDHDHVATIVFAHWPGQVSAWYEDLRRISRRGPVLGRFVTLADYFSLTDGAGRLSHFDADRYRTPYLRQAVAAGQADPISAIARHHRRHALLGASSALATCGSLLSNTPEPIDAPLRAALDDEGASAASAEEATALDRRLDEAWQAQAARFAQVVCGSSQHTGRGWLAANPSSFARRVGLELPGDAPLPDVAEPVIAAQESGGRKLVVVDVPGMGFAWIPAGSGSRGAAKPSKPLAEENVLRNEFFETIMHRDTGGVQSIHDFRVRGNRLSQQLAIRLPAPRGAPGESWRHEQEEPPYSVMAADSLEITAAGPALGEITTRGRLMHPEGQVLARYEQCTQLWRGARVLRIGVVLDIDWTPDDDPWNSYLACRFAWNDAGAELRRDVAMGGCPTEANRLEAPHYVEMREASARTAILSAGAPYHRRAGMRMLDTLLVVRGETARRFQLGVGVDLPHPIHGALDLLAPVVVTPAERPPASGSTGWFFHIDARHVIATHWEPLVEESRVTGVVVRLMETAGRAARAVLRSFRPVAAARQTDFLGQTLCDVPLAGDKMTVDLAAHEWVQVELRFAT